MLRKEFSLGKFDFISFFFSVEVCSFLVIFIAKNYGFGMVDGGRDVLSLL